MFDLDAAVARWRRSLRYRRVFLRDDLDEMEDHLRDHIEEMRASGMTVEAAFHRAKGEFEGPSAVDREYRKVFWAKVRHRGRLGEQLKTRLAMLRTYIKTAFRNANRQRGFAAINVGGLAVGLATCLLIGLYVQDELSFDTIHTKGDRIYRLGGSTVGWPYGRILEDEYPEVESVVYMRAYPRLSIKHRDGHFFEETLYADEGFFELFDFHMPHGDRTTALARPYSVVLSASFARTLFGSTDAVGQNLTMADSLQFTVTGVVEVPRRSHIQFDALLSFETLRAMYPGMVEAQLAGGWLNLNVVNYVLLGPEVDGETFAEKIRGLPMERAADYLAGWGSEYRLGLTPMDEIYLQSDQGNAVGPKGDVDQLFLLLAVGLFLLLIACVNFVNLATARSTTRAREIGVRKAIGSSRGALVRQFLTESAVTALVAAVLSSGLALGALPYFNELTSRSYALTDLLTLPMGLTLLLLVATVGLVAGCYPAIAITSFRPADVLRGGRGTGPSGRRLRQALVVLQFSISGALIIGTLVVLSQLRFMQEQKLGFESEQVLVLDAQRAPGSVRAASAEAFRDRLDQVPEVQAVTSAWAVPGRSGWRGQLSFPEGYPEGESISLEYVAVDHDYVDALGMEIVAGRDFDRAFSTDAQTALLINETAVARAGWPSAAAAVGKRFPSPGSGKPDGVVIGVVKDYHHHGLQEAIGPMMFGIRSSSGLYALRISAGDAHEVRTRIAEIWQQFYPDYPFETSFLDEDFARSYDDERRTARIFATFVLLTIIVACLGLFGLAAFTASRRTKEIGVRKVTGASGIEISLLLSREFVRLVAISLVVATPMAWLVMQQWLEGFAYRTRIGLWEFALGGLLVLGIAVLTVGYQAVRAARISPVKALRYE